MGSVLSSECDETDVHTADVKRCEVLRSVLRVDSKHRSIAAPQTMHR